MRPDDGQPAGLYPTGSPRGYLVAGALLALAAWTIWRFLNSPYIDAINRPIMAGISGATFGGLALHALLRACIPAVILADGTLRIRDWRGRMRAFGLERLVRVTWSYRYEEGRWAGYDGGRAWLEFEFDDRPGRPAVVDYAGRSRHATIRRFLDDLTVRAGLRWDPMSDPLTSADLPGADITWRRRGGSGGG